MTGGDGQARLAPDDDPDGLELAGLEVVEAELMPRGQATVGNVMGGDRLTPLQVKAVGFLLLGYTKRKAAQEVGIGDTTIRNWCKDSVPFRRALAEGVEDARASMRPLLLSSFAAGVRKLVDLLEAEDEEGEDLKIQLGAAVALTKLVRAGEQESIGVLDSGHHGDADPEKEWRDQYTTRRRVFVPHEMQLEAILCDTRYLVLVCGVQSGKRLKPDELVRTPTGWTTMRELKPGSVVTGGTGRPCRVLAVFREPKPLPFYKLTFDDGASVEACGDHLWRVVHPSDRKRGRRDRWRVMSTREILSRWGSEPTSANRVMIPTCSSEGEWQHVPLDPYLLGALLADGSLGAKAVRWTKRDLGTADRVRSAVAAGGDMLKLCDMSEKDYYITGGNTLWATRRLGLDGKRSWEKHIPRCYLDNDIATRRELLAGLMDGDGTCSKPTAASIGGGCTYSTTSPLLRDGVVELVRSLGGKASWKERRTHYTHKGERRAGRASYRVRARLTFNPFLASRKAQHWLRADGTHGTSGRAGTPDGRLLYKIEPAGESPGICIEVDDPTHTFVTRDHIVTHNTDTGALNFWGRIQREDNPEAVYWMVAPNTIIGKVMRKRFVSRAPAGWLPNPKGSGQEVNRTWTLKNGATVEFRSAHTNRGENLVAETVSGAWLDEFTLMEEGVWRVSLSARLTTTGGWAIFSGTPRGKGWAWDDVWRPTLEHDDKRDSKWSGYTWPSSANPLITEAEEEEQRRNLPEAYYQRERRASWEVFHGQVYEDWSESRMVLDLSGQLEQHGDGAQVEAAFDWGFGKPGAMLVGRLTAAGIWEALFEVHEAKQLPDWWEQKAIEAVERFRVTTFWCDPAEPDRIASLRKALRKWVAKAPDSRAMPKVRAARNDVRPGIRHVASLFKQDRVRVHSGCKILITQLTSYQWAQDRHGDDTEEPKKENDHLADCTRYLTWSHEKHKGGGSVSMGGAGAGTVGRPRGRRRGSRRRR